VYFYHVHYHHHQAFNVRAAGAQAFFGSHIRKTGHNPPRGPSVYCWVLTTANAARTNGLKCLPKHGGTHDNTFLVIHPMTDQRCNFRNRTHTSSALIAGLSSSSYISMYHFYSLLFNFVTFFWSFALLF
jgi:hypothetical protein